MTDQAVQPEVIAPIADQRREQMLRAALEVICARGFADTRIIDIAERSGISPALVIYYFKTKDRLLTEALRYYEDRWHANGQRRMAALPTNALRLEEFVAMNLVKDDDDDPELDNSLLLWLDFWAQAARNPVVAEVRRQSDERWRDVITTLVQAGQEAGEFAGIDALEFTLCLSALLDGLTVQLALGEPSVDSGSAFELTMRFAAGQLGFRWEPNGRGREPGSSTPAGDR
jgi:AcrR family transcriptional regulator